MKKILGILSALLVLGLTGCVTTNISIPRGRFAQAAGSTLATTSRPIPPFVPSTVGGTMLGVAGGAVAGAAGGVAAVRSGYELVKEHGLEDVAVPLARDLAAHLAGNHGIVMKPGVQVAVTSVDSKEIAAAATGLADWVLDVQTTGWGCTHHPLKWTRYQVNYSAKLRLIDVKQRQVVAEGWCTWRSSDKGDHPTFDELFADNAAVLHKELDKGRNAAATYFKEKILVEKK